LRTWLRATSAELVLAAAEFARKLNSAKGTVKIIIPMKGWSSVDYPGSATYNPEQDSIFINELKKLLRGDIEVITFPANMEDPEFGEAVTKTCMSSFS
jgi:uncharacterized protein (UPF0261 family)